MEVRKMQEKLAALIIDVCCNDLLEIRINLMEYTLEVINYINNNVVEENDLTIFKGLIKEALMYGAEERVVESKHNKRRRYCELTKQVREEISKNCIFDVKDELITDLNSWIKSLKIFKLGNLHLEEDIYKNSYELYEFMRRIILKRNSQNYKKIYVVQIVEKLESEENLKKLPSNIKISEFDYELSQIIKLVKNNLGFDGKGILSKQRYYSFEREANINRVKMLIKN